MSGVTEPTATVAAEPVGYMVLLMGARGDWEDDWDGTVHLNPESAERSAVEARIQNYEAVVVALHPVSGAA